MPTLESASRAGCLVTFSIVAGAAIGIAAAAASLVPDAFFWGALLGAPIGAIVSPAIVAGLFRKTLDAATLIVFVPSLTVAIIGGLVFGPPMTLASVVVFCAMAGVCYFVLPDTDEWARPAPPGCPHCGYDTTGLTQCPECGATG